MIARESLIKFLSHKVQVALQDTRRQQYEVSFMENREYTSAYLLGTVDAFSRVIELLDETMQQERK
jgi:hypothetical protein